MYSVVSVFFIADVPSIIIIFFYGSIIAAVFKRSSSSISVAVENSVEQRRSAAMLQQARRAALICVYCMLGFILLWLPFVVIRILQTFAYFLSVYILPSITNGLHTKMDLLQALAFLFVAINPILYCGTSRFVSILETCNKPYYTLLNFSVWRNAVFKMFHVPRLSVKSRTERSDVGPVQPSQHSTVL